ncbi:hypothetical protein CSOJ01_05847 [Colletotrichum sojae]|uniref:Uncharacterized protein n=1 Tax=Colletotrichum sojae TaxID=2175907 RepID=A0A8H6JDU7_9PEZI|nr:hypothetical protein CSOJ01_05847 [Colletotrichum sojae]
MWRGVDGKPAADQATLRNFEAANKENGPDFGRYVMFSSPLSSPEEKKRRGNVENDGLVSEYKARKGGVAGLRKWVVLPPQTRKRVFFVPGPIQASSFY